MAQTLHTQTPPAGAETLHRIGRRMDLGLGTVRDWLRTRRTVAALRRLTPAQLEDIGLSAADIETFARTGRL